MKILNIAHRGFSGKYPENTMLAFEKAVEAGANGIEMDVHLTQDGVIVINHDETIDRMYNGEGFIANLTYKEISKYNAKNKDEVTQEKMPTIDEFFEYFKDKDLFLDIEIKNTIIKYKNIEEKLLKKIYDYKMEKKVMLTTFSGISIRKIRTLDKRIKTGLLYKYDIYKSVDYGKSIGANAMVPYFMHCLEKGYVKNLKDNGFMVNCYTVNNEATMKKLIANDIDGIITNYPDRLKSVIDDIK